ncbi:D-alanyl-D-alanine carboxypeptidase family protein [Streptomyces sp. 2224.1]|uniref:D-alanyl-D-alanine carboxypeptidase family protein n=1 Tax=Streptomyces sp. 2224.1 TaxID=1881020 RepID=UPI002109904F|nr:D-alanyl-D-alanine carboxypeptidase [Streptomyces sp. 2224.1]
MAAWVAGKGDEDAEDAEAGTEAGAEDAEAGTEGAEDGDRGDGGAEAGEGADGDAEGAVAKPEVKQGTEPEAESGKSASGKAESVAEGKSSSKAEPSAKAEPATKAEPADGAESADEVVDQPTAVFKTVGPQKGKSDEKAGGKAGAASASKGKGKGKADGKGSGEGDADADVEVDADADGTAVDEATRVFAVAKLKGKGAAAGAVDQATTAFKITPPVRGEDAAKVTPPAKGMDAAKDKAQSNGAAEGKSEGKGKPGAKDEAAAEGKTKDTAEGKTKADAKGESKTGAKTGAKGETKTGAKDDAKADAKVARGPERDSERTSQFVALKSADDGTAGKSLGKTAPRTPARTSDKAVEQPSDKAAGKTSDKPVDRPAGKAADKTGDKTEAKPEGKAAGALPAAKPADKAAETTSPAKPAGRPGAMPPATTGAPAAAAPAALPESERTKQEPLPPLDLLAQLTNTPPPPETPLRTVVRRFKIWTPLAVLLVIIFVVAQAVRPLPDPTLTVGDAASSYTFEGSKLAVPWPDQGQAAVKVVGSGDLGTFGKEKPVPTASVAKIMTAYVVLRDHPLKKDEGGPKIEVDAKAVTEGGSRHESRIEGLKAGQKFSEQNMLKMLMIPSGNNIARLLARWDTKSDNEAAFVKKMNAAAKDLGMKNTTYTDPSGLDPKTVSTAVDQLKLAEAVMKFDAFRPIVATPNTEIPGLPKRINSNIDNLLLAGLSIKGIKTGSSTAAGGTLSWAAYKTVDGKDQLILGTMMDQHFKGLDPDGANSLTLVKQNSQKVIEAVRNALTSATAVKKGQVVGYVDDGLNGRTPVVATKDLKAIGVPGQKLKLSVGDGGKTVPHTAKAGTEVGVLTVGNGESMQKVPVALQKDLVEPTFGAKLVRIT